MLHVLLLLLGIAHADITGMITQPGGSANQLQYNNGDFGGVSGSSVSGTTVTIGEVRVTTAALGSGTNISTFNYLGALNMASGQPITLAGPGGYLTSSSSITANAFFDKDGAIGGVPAAIGIATAALSASTVSLQTQIGTLGTSTGTFNIWKSTVSIDLQALNVSTANLFTTKLSTGGGALSQNLTILGSLGVAGGLTVDSSATFKNAVIVNHADGINVQNGSGASRLLIGPSGAGSYIQMQGGGNLTLNGNSSETMLKVLDNRAVGVSVIAPTAMLHVSSAPSGNNVSLQIDGDATYPLRVGTSVYIQSDGSLSATKSSVTANAFYDRNGLVSAGSSFNSNWSSVTVYMSPSYTSTSVTFVCPTGSSITMTMPANPRAELEVIAAMGTTAGGAPAVTFICTKSGDTNAFNLLALGGKGTTGPLTGMAHNDTQQEIVAIHKIFPFALTQGDTWTCCPGMASVGAGTLALSNIGGTTSQPQFTFATQSTQ